MKNIKFLIITTLLLINNLIANTTNPHPFFQNHSQMTISSYEESGGQTSILLSNGTLWVYHDQDLFSEENGWKVEDRVQIDYDYFSDTGYFLENISFQGRIPITLGASSNLVFETRIESIDVEAGKVVLDDGTVWHVGTWSSSWMEDWKPGDLIMTGKQDKLVGFATHWMINLDPKQKERHAQPGNVRAQLLHNPNLVLEETVDTNKRPAQFGKLAISKLFHHDDNTLFVELSNGMLFDCTLAERVLKVGDILEVSVEKRQFLIRDDRTREQFEVLLLNSPRVKAPRIQEIKHKKITFDTGSVIVTKERVSRWKVGDRLVFSPTYGSSYGELINLDNPRKSVTAFVIR